MANAEVATDSTTRLDDLAELGKRLNEESNQINGILSKFEQSLAEMNLGVEAWVRPYSFILPGWNHSSESKSRWSALGIYSIERPTEGEEFLSCQVLGYGVMSNPATKGPKFGLLVRTEHYHKETEDGEACWAWKHSDDPVPLLQASRELRIAALENLEYLVDALEIEARQLLSSIEKGRKTVEKL